MCIYINIEPSHTKHIKIFHYIYTNLILSVCSIGNVVVCTTSLLSFLYRMLVPAVDSYLEHIPILDIYTTSGASLYPLYFRFD